MLFMWCFSYALRQILCKLISRQHCWVFSA